MALNQPQPDSKCPSALTNADLKAFKNSSDSYSLKGRDGTTRKFFGPLKEKTNISNALGNILVQQKNTPIILASSRIDIDKIQKTNSLMCTYSRKSTLGNGNYQFSIQLDD